MKNIRLKSVMVVAGVVTGLAILLSFAYVKVNNSNQPAQVASIRSFDAFMIDDVAFITWITAYEGSGQLTLEKSTDGNNFVAVEQFEQNGASSKYTFVDNNPNFGLSYYRLNGEMTPESENITPLFNHEGPLSLNVDSNKDEILISTPNSQDGNYLVTLSDNDGRIYLVQSCRLNSNKNISLSRKDLNLESNLYTLRLYGDSWSIDKKLYL
ncbi:MAG: hypothetical protein O2887_17740 [Bacteroidetes bacterium]|nr:hypothetical protein [Bacteroidota bacterium]